MLNKLFILIGVTLLVHAQALRFAFWKDDWINIWLWLTKSSEIQVNWNHPGTAIEFAVFTQLFGTTSLYWQLLGIGLRLTAALAVGKLITNLTEKKNVGMLACLFYAVGVAGVDAVGWVSAHVVYWDTIFMCLGLAWLLEYFKSGKRKVLIIGLGSIFLAFISDPWRMVPVFIIVGILWQLFGVLPLANPMATHKGTPGMGFPGSRHPSLLLIIFICIIVTLLGMLMWPSIVGTELLSFITRNIHNPLFLLQKIYVVNNYVQSMVHLWFGWIIPFSDDSGTGTYNGFIFRFGLFFIGVMCGLIWKIHKSDKQAGRRMGFLWILALLMYVPNWLFEPRLTMAISHRYMVVSAVGIAGLMAYIFSLIPRKLAIAGGIFFLLGNLWMVDRYYQDNLKYRSQDLTTKFINKVNLEVGTYKDRSLVFVISGEGRLWTRHLGYADALPFALEQKLDDLREWPIVTDDSEKIASWLCGKPVINTVAGKEYIYMNKLRLDGVYGWDIRADGEIVSQSLRLREQLREKIRADIFCQPS